MPLHTRGCAPERAGLALALALLPLGVQAPAQGPEAWPGEPFERLDASVRESLAALDPARAGWSSEVRSDAAGVQLAKIARWLETPRAQSEALLAGVFTAEFRCRQPPDPLTSAFDDGNFRVRRAAGARAEVERAGFLAWLLRPLADAHDIHAAFELVHVEEDVDEDPDGLVTQAVLLVEARGAAGALQLNSRWQCHWREDPDGATPPRLALVRILEHEEILAPGPGEALFTERSAGVFGANAAWEEQLVPELSAWRARLDTRLGLPLLGHAAGIAIGDADGDGLEDLYLCEPGGLPNKLFLRRPDGTVVDRSAEAGVDFLDVSRAALLVDLDGDGDRDLAVNAADRLLLLANDGRARFWLQSALEAADTTSLAAADVDLDGDLDLYACAYASPFDHAALPVPYHDANNGKPNLLFENQGDWIFVDATAARGLDQNNRRFSLAAAFEDYDQDGDPDLYVANDFGRNNLYRNEGGSFVDVAAAAGVEDPSAGMGVAWGDADGDGRFDLFVSHPYSPAGKRVAFQPRFQAGASADVRAQYQRHAGGSTLFRNRGDGTFEHVTGPDPANQGPLGSAMGRWAWGALFADLNGDGWQDLLAPNGLLSGQRGEDLASFFWRQVVSQSPLEAAPAEDSLAPYRASWAALNTLLRCGYSLAGREPNCAFLNLGGQGFANVSAVTGFDFLDDARALALVDWDGDGDQDVFLTSRTSPRLRFLRNDQASRNASVTLELRGTRANRDAIGARVELQLGSEAGPTRRLVRGVRAGEGCLSQSSTRLTLGFGRSERLERVRVTWPGGEREDFTGVEPGKAWRLVQGSGRAEVLALPRPQPLPSTPLVSQPAAASARVPLVRPVPLPRLELLAEDGASLPLFGLQAGGAGTGTGKPILLQLFSSTSAACARELEELARHAAALADAGLAPLALSVEPPDERARAGEFLRARHWPFPWATATPDALELLDALAAILLDSERRLELPASFLVDARGALRVLYLGPVGAGQVLADLERCALGDGALFDAASPFPGRWMFPALASDADFFEGRLRARGLEAAAREFARGRLDVLHRAPADLLQEFGRRSAVEGRLDEAGQFFRRALAADPRHFGALFDWAVVRHRQEDLAGAAELYGKALALQPEHADARFNLALVRLGLGDREGAARQLRWLKARGVPGLEELERLLASAAPR